MRYPYHFYTIIDTHAEAMTNMVFHDTVQRAINGYLPPRVITKRAYEIALVTNHPTLDVVA
jgi:hypothetical protein